MDKLLEEIRDMLHTIQSSRKSCDGSYHNFYVPQLPVEQVDELAERVAARLSPFLRLKADWANRVWKVHLRRSVEAARRHRTWKSRT